VDKLVVGFTSTCHHDVLTGLMYTLLSDYRNNWMLDDDKYDNRITWQANLCT